MRPSPNPRRPVCPSETYLRLRQSRREQLGKTSMQARKWKLPRLGQLYRDPRTLAPQIQRPNQPPEHQAQTRRRGLLVVAQPVVARERRAQSHVGLVARSFSLCMICIQEDSCEGEKQPFRDDLGTSELYRYRFAE